MSQTSTTQIFSVIADDIHAKHTYNDIIPKLWLHNRFQTDLPKFGGQGKSDLQKHAEFNIAVGRLTYILLHRHEMFISSDRKAHGYRIIKSNEQGELIDNQEMPNIRKSLSKMVRVKSNVNHSELTPREIQDANDNLNSAVTLQSKMVSTLDIYKDKLKRS